MPNFVAPVRKPEGPPISPKVRGAFEARRAKIARLLKKYKNTGKADPYLIEQGIVHA